MNTGETTKDSLAWDDIDGDSAPLCHICSTDPYETAPIPRLQPGIYIGPEGMKILVHPAKRICRLSGMAYYPERPLYVPTLQVPWDENTGVVFSKEEQPQPINRRLLATAYVHQNSIEPEKHKLSGFLVHARCWELLRTHRAWDLGRGDTRTIWKALRAKAARDWKFYSPQWEKFRDQSNIVGPDWDPYFNKEILSYISRARRRTRKRFKVSQRKNTPKTLLNCLPPELLSMVADSLAAADVSAMQQAMGCFLGDAYWRSRISTEHFHEVKSLGKEVLDWEFLASKLETVDAWFDKRRTMRDAWNDDDCRILSRRWVLQQLDELTTFMPAARD
ncbi:hypothetical protein BJX61DRAFT_545033 [Aspergillus egyptiacus]|nr:hypothetical protein BJX61DRAFT_545033 [Aspergillus egyptiacus]